MPKPARDALPPVGYVSPSLGPLMEQAAGIGHIAAVSDIDEVYRTVPAFADAGDAAIPALSVAAVARYLDVPLNRIAWDPRGAITFSGAHVPGGTTRDLTVPTDRAGRLLVDYAGRWQDNTYLSLVAVYEAIKEGRWNELAPLVNGKIVLVLPATADADKRRTPFEPKAPGGFIHASAMNSILLERNLRAAPASVTLPTMAVLALLSAGLGLRLRSWRGVAAAGTLAAGHVWAAYLLLAHEGLVLPVIQPLAVIGAAVVLGVAVRQSLEDRNRRWIQQALRRYLGRTIGDAVARNPNALKLGGVPQDVTVMFADLSGFTTRSTQVAPEELAEITNRYLGLLLEEIDVAGGYVVQFLGDCVMAIWGAPDPDPAHAVHAAQCALAITRRIDAETARAKENKEWWFGIKVGLNTGPALVGNIGTEKRYNFTAVGETVNVASRIEGVASAYACPIAVGDETARRTADNFLLRELDTVMVKGRAEPITVHQLIAARSEATPAQHAGQRRYAEALTRYRAGDFAVAARLWEALAEEEPTWQSHAGAAASGSNPARCMAARARRLATASPGKSWNGVWELESK